MDIRELRVWIQRMEDVEKATIITAYEQRRVAGPEGERYVVVLEAQDEHGTIVETLELMFNLKNELE